MDQLPLLFTNSNELLALNRAIQSLKIEALARKLDDLEHGNDTTIVNALKQYTRMLLILTILNRPNKDSPRNKRLFTNSISLLFSLKPLLRKLLNDYLPKMGTFNKELISNTFTVLISLLKYPTALKYQRNYLSIYLTIISLQFLLEKYTSFKNFWILFPFTFAKTWEYYNINPSHCPNIAMKILNFFCKESNYISGFDGLLRKLSKLDFCFILPGFLLLNYRKHHSIKSVKSVIQTIRLTLITLSVTSLAKYLTAGGYISSISNEKMRLQVIGLIASLPTIVYRQSSSLWLYFARMIMISLNRKHSIQMKSRLNTYRVDKVMIMISLLVILVNKDDEKLAKNKLIRKLAGYIDNGRSLLL